MTPRPSPALLLILCLACSPATPPPGEETAGEDLLEAGRYAEALSLLRARLDSEASPRVHGALGTVHARLGRLDSSAFHYEACLALDPERAEIQHNLGVVLADLGRLDEAVAAVERALGLDPGFAAAHLTLGLFRMKVGQYGRAEEAFRAAAREGAPSAHRHLGGLYVRLGRHAEADEELERALRADAADAASHRLLAVSRRARGDLAGASASFERAVELDPWDQEALFGLANTLIASGDRERGQRLLERFERLRLGEDEVAQLRRLLDGSPGDVEARMALAARFLQDGRTAEAANQYEVALAYDAALVEARLQLGRLYRERGDTLGVLRVLSDAPVEDVRLAFSLGSLLLMRGDLARGAAALERALALDPHHGEAWNNLGNLRLMQGDREAAAEAFRRAVAVDSPSAQAALNLGTLRVRAGHLDSAAAWYRRALGIDPGLVTAHLALARLQEHRGLRAEAAAAYEGLLGAAADPALQEEARASLRRLRAPSGGG